MAAAVTWGDRDEQLTEVARAALAAIDGHLAANGDEQGIVLIRVPLPAAFTGRRWRTGLASSPAITHPDDVLGFLLAEIGAVARANTMPVLVPGKVRTVRRTVNEPHDRLTSLAGAMLHAADAADTSECGGTGHQVVALVRTPPAEQVVAGPAAPFDNPAVRAALRAAGIEPPARVRLSFQGGVGVCGFRGGESQAVGYLADEAEGLAAAYGLPYARGTVTMPANVN